MKLTCVVNTGCYWMCREGSVRARGWRHAQRHSACHHWWLSRRCCLRSSVTQAASQHHTTQPPDTAGQCHTLGHYSQTKPKPLGDFSFMLRHTHTRPFNGPFSGTTRVSRYQKGKPIWILLKEETVSGSGISWAICKSASRSRQITMPATHHSVFFTGRMPFLLPNQQRQSTEGNSATTRKQNRSHWVTLYFC